MNLLLDQNGISYEGSLWSDEGGAGEFSGNSRSENH